MNKLLIIDDSAQAPAPAKKTRTKRLVNVLDKCYTTDDSIEIGVDEAGRGPMM